MTEQQSEDDALPQQPSESQQPADVELAFPDLRPGDAWGESITKQRADELEAMLQVWEGVKEHSGGLGPFDCRRNFSSVEEALSWRTRATLTGSDVFWLAARTVVRRYDELAIASHASQLTSPAPFLLLSELHLEDAQLIGAHLEGAALVEVHLEGANLHSGFFQNATLLGAHLQGAILTDTHLEGTQLSGAHLDGAYLNMAFLDRATSIGGVTLSDTKWGSVFLTDVRWGEANLAIVDWTYVRYRLLGLRKHIEAIEFGEELKARSTTDSEGKPKDEITRRREFEHAVRANRQLATALRQQGLNEDADRFAYKAQQLQRQVLRRQQRYGTAFGSWLLDMVAGYGYKPMRTLTVYLLAIIAFAITYFALGQTVGPHLSPLGAVVFSMTSFHGRGFFPGGIVLDDPITVLAAFEAFIGLVIEVSFIATFTQRFFAR